MEQRLHLLILCTHQITEIIETVESNEAAFGDIQEHIRQVLTDLEYIYKVSVPSEALKKRITEINRNS